MHARIVQAGQRLPLLVRPLRDGDTDTVAAVFERLGPESRRARFNGPKPFLTTAELRQLAQVDTTRHALVGYVDGDPLPVAIARLVRDGRSAEIAFGVADAYHGRGIGSALAAELLADARAAGIRTISALVANDNRAAVAQLRRDHDALEVRLEGAELWISGPVPA
ncbi:MAG TPA: GNAT family N-acetyltransferase [Gaiellaceae bacterium]|nr:GNAT family N-acetyltransferase [Gaiellaceae bacterium]